jgi:N-carbamoyl-L-amino-acid hydrolase
MTSRQGGAAASLVFAKRTQTATAQQSGPEARQMQFGGRILELADHLAQWSEALQGLTCTYLSPAHREVAAEISRLMQKAGLDAHTDCVANVVGRYASKNANARTVIIASHYDTVTNAGKYDGRLGILTGLLVAEHLAQSGKHLPFHLELIAFSDEAIPASV